MHWVRHIFLIALATSPSLAAAEDTAGSLAAEALGANPTLDARRAQVEQLSAMAQVAGAWPDPMLAIELSNVPTSSFALGGHGMSGVQLRASQTTRPLRWSSMQHELGDAQTEVAQQALVEAEWQLGATVERLYWRLTLSRLLRAVTEEHLARTQELHSAVLARYEVGKAGQHAVLRLEVLRDRLADSLDDFERTDAVLTAALTRATGRTAGAFETPTEIAPLSPPPDGAWAGLAQTHRPELARMQAQVRQHEAAAQLARNEGMPDLSFWLGYRVRTFTGASDSGTDLVSAGLSVPLGLNSSRKASGLAAAHLHSAEGSRAAYAAELDRIDEQLASVTARWHRAFSKAGTYDIGLLPAARATLDTTLSDYTLDKADFASLYDAQVVLLDLERAWLIATVETHLQRTEALAVLGTTPEGGAQ